MAPSSHESLFSYSITRPYPYRWFTPVLIAGAIVVTALFTFLNFANNAYQLEIGTSFNPNATLATQTLSHWPSFLKSKNRPSCQSQYFPVGSQVFTNNTALFYTISGVWRTNGNVTFSGNSAKSSGTGIEIFQALGYMANTLQNRSINYIAMDFAAMDRTANQFAYSEWGVEIRSYMSCSILWNGDINWFNLTSTSDYVPDNVAFTDVASFLGTEFLDRDSQTKASLWWGESLMSTYWALVTKTVQDIRVNRTRAGLPGVRKGTVSFRSNNASISDITNPSFFDIDYRFIVDNGLGSFDVISAGDNAYKTTIGNLQLHQQYPNIWSEADSLAKSTWSTILTDLGQILAHPNILTNATLLQSFTLPFPTLSNA